MEQDRTWKRRTGIMVRVVSETFTPMPTSQTSPELVTVGRVHSTLTQRAAAPRQGYEGAPDARIEIDPAYVHALDGMEAGQDILILTWLHQAQRDVLKVHPRGDLKNPLTGVFATRSPDRPNPIGLHRVRLVSIENGRWLHVDGLEAIDGTPVVDIKPVLEHFNDA
jgi:tRNA-Thr(GGU) m(6)t(6)A37 methyltransferase TsaA